MKKFLSIFLSLFCAVCFSFTLVGCKTNKKTARVNIVCTVFAEYDWAKELTRGVDGVEINLLVDNGMEMHSYQPSVADVANIATCDLFIYVGGESDEWASDALQNKSNSKRKVLNLLDILGLNAREEEFKEGMDGEPEEEPEFDEHVWLSIKNAKVFCNKIAEALCEIDPENESKYNGNLSLYNSKLSTLDMSYETMALEAEKDTLIFADRFPFLYLVKDYNLEYYAAFVGCSTETNASANTIAFLANKVKELGIKVIFNIENTTVDIASTVKETAKINDIEIKVLNSMQSVKKADIDAGATYLKIMESNLNTLRLALN